MFLTLSNFFDDESSTIQVDSSVIDVSEFKDEEDQAFLITQGHELLRIDAKAAYAKEQINKIIDQKADDAKGKIIYDIQERFKENKELKGGLMRYFHSLGYWTSNMEQMGLVMPEKYTHLTSAFSWANSYRAALEMQKKLKGALTPEEIQNRAASLSTDTLARIYSTHSTKDRERIYKAEEKWKQIKADPDITSRDDDYVSGYREVQHSERSFNTYEAKVAELQALVDAKDAELTKFKYDEDVQRETRIKVLTDALTIGVPQATADLNKYIKDAEWYAPEVRRHFDDQIKVLADMCGDYLSRL
jgi:hypothetical protein